MKGDSTKSISMVPLQMVNRVSVSQDLAPKTVKLEILSSDKETVIALIKLKQQETVTT